ncbi:hypothetical protein GCM10009594_16250 [Kocuria palustris]|uniref:type I-E CRISPR-associated protein Cse2/CasB n=1 Tax=Kocuria palustris TaxID=71999 RepID=UPI001958D1D9|nr:type I-E CRISPR-associated protein Cse2/CasB [Kocuria palustris]MBM7822811.1 CRISPR system Cascade subunit CasB [Kocuria palustris]
MTTTDSTPELNAGTGAYVSQLQARFLAGDPQARAILALLRQCVDEAPGHTPQMWEIALEVTPQNLIGRGDEPSPAESAVHQSLTLYGVHQRGNTSQMHYSDGRSFGYAMGRLMRGRAPSTKKRYDALLGAQSPRSRAYHLRSLMGLLSADGIPLDHGQLAWDLYLLQVDRHRDSISRRWGRDFYRAFSSTAKSTDAAFTEAASDQPA